MAGITCLKHEARVALPVIAIVFCITGRSSVAFPTGAPDTVCGSLEPGHNVDPLEHTFFSIELSQQTYVEGEVLFVSIVGADLKGFIIQARSRSVDANSQTPVALGTFGEPFDDSFQLMRCNGRRGNSATHQNNNAKKSIFLLWTAPSEAEGEIEFVATVVEEYAVYYMNIKSVVIRPQNQQTDFTRISASTLGSTTRTIPPLPTLPPFQATTTLTTTTTQTQQNLTTTASSVAPTKSTSKSQTSSTLLTPTTLPPKDATTTFSSTTISTLLASSAAPLKVTTEDDVSTEATEIDGINVTTASSAQPTKLIPTSVTTSSLPTFIYVMILMQHQCRTYV